MESRIIKTRKITTWKTQKYCCSCFKYGSSIVPPIGSFLLTQIPSVALTVDLCIHNHYVLMAFLIIFQIVVNVAMLTVICTDPGVLPQIIYRYETNQQLFDIPCKAFEQEHKYLITTHSLLHHQKYCPQCNIYRPIRSIHCGACNHCVERYDHHCPWLSICIGKYNYKFFIFYLSSLIVLILFAFIIGLVFVIENFVTNKLPEDYILQILVTIFAGIFILPLLRLLIYHFQLMKKGVTTNEDLKKTYKIIQNRLPYDNVECSLKEKNQYPIVSKFHYHQGRKSSRTERMTELNSSILVENQKKQKQSIFNSLIKNEQL